MVVSFTTKLSNRFGGVENIAKPIDIELSAAIRDLPEEEKLDLLSELWDSLDHPAPVPEWHKEELDCRMATSDSDAFTTWSEAKARILGSK